MTPLSTPASRTASPFRAVLCPIDFSTHARTALRYAAIMARRAQAPLTVLYVNDPFLVAAAAAAYDERVLARQSADELARFIGRTLGRSPGIAVRGVVALGPPAQEIRKAVRRERADLVVIGSEGLSGAPRLFFGSTTARVLAQALVPVLAVPPGRHGAPADDWPGAGVLAAVDLSRDAGKDVAAAGAIASWLDAPLSLVHVVEPTRTPGWLPIKRGAHDRTRLADARARLERAARAAGGAVPPALHVLAGHPAEQIAALAADPGIGLVVVTLRGDDRLFGDRKGATTYQVVCQAATPVLAVPAGWKPTVAR